MLSALLLPSVLSVCMVSSEEDANVAHEVESALTSLEVLAWQKEYKMVIKVHMKVLTSPLLFSQIALGIKREDRKSVV